MIRVVNLSPAIDVTYQLGQLTLGEALRVEKVLRVPGGKGVNVARVIAAGKFPTSLVLPLGGMAGDWIAKQITESGISFTATAISSETRTCVAVVAEEVTVLNEPAAEISEAEFAELLKSFSAKSAVNVLSGSIPKNLTDGQIEQLLDQMSSSCDHLIVDTSGSPLLLAAKKSVDLLKPNLQEALAATGTQSANEAIQKLLSLGAKRVLLSDGEGYAQLASKDKVLRAKPKTVSGNPTGAGDAMVALAAIELMNNASDEELLRKAVAAGSLAVAEPVAGQIDWSKLEEVASLIQVEV